MDESKQDRRFRGSFGKYTIKRSGINRRGNHWCARDYGASNLNPNTYYFRNIDGSFYYFNPDGSKYFNNGRGYVDYTDRSGGGWKEYGGKRRIKESSQST
ncbi:hypothetical protein M407DRAFT_29176 [Tulasnella calospora MUT 4182]|uniref:Uncharacterized protein n=1 Tax=Tulasnella calospora MUT 4182 TaxID=1051891 RepID=A0A0C3KI63_9AGAM|nr:hypothetical protein M407DRAFT_29176 [Tulasnella calospora MUT 4182]